MRDDAMTWGGGQSSPAAREDAVRTLTSYPEVDADCARHVQSSVNVQIQN